jgi:alkylhydroperoxidase family enzyme
MQATPSAHQAVITRILEGDGRTSRAQRRAAFDNVLLEEPLHGLISKVAERPTQITDEDVAAAKESGVSEDQIFELVVCAAVGQATRQYQSALEALAAAMTDGER